MAFLSHFVFYWIFVTEGDETLQEVLQNLRLEQLNGEPFIFRISRQRVLEDLLAYYASEECDLSRPLAIEFEGEPGMDGGGLTREFFTLVIRSVINDNRVFVTNYPPFQFNYSVSQWREHFYKTFGKIVAHSIISGGPGLAGFPRWLYTYIVTGSLEEAAAECTRADLPTDIDRALVEEVQSQ